MAPPATDDLQFPRSFYVIVPFCVCLLALILAEVALSFLAPTPFASEHNLYFLPDPHTGFRPKPNSQGVYASGAVAYINRHGHRSEDVRLKKPKGTYRILVLGDSFTIGANVAQEDAYSAVLQRLLRQREEQPIEVVNSGIGAWGPFQYAQYFEHYGVEFEPDLLVLGFFVGNDSFQQVDRIELTRTAVRGRRISRGDTPEEVPRAAQLKVALYEHSHLFRRVVNRRAFVVRKEYLKDRGQPRDTADLIESYLAVQRNRMHKNHRPLSRSVRKRAEIGLAQIERIRKLAQELEIPLLLVLIPDENQVNAALPALVSQPGESYDLGMPQSFLKETFRQNGIEVLDLLEDFRRDERRLYMDDSHWTPAGHQLAAKRISEAIWPLPKKRQENASSEEP